MNAILSMKKLDIAALKEAFENKSVGSQTKKTTSAVH